jgi:hypothetical protein
VAPDREVWAAKQAQALRERRVEALDWDNLSRAIEILGRRGRSRVILMSVAELNVGLMPR